MTFKLGHAAGVVIILLTGCQGEESPNASPKVDSEIAQTMPAESAPPEQQQISTTSNIYRQLTYLERQRGSAEILTQLCIEKWGFSDIPPNKKVISSRETRLLVDDFVTIDYPVEVYTDDQYEMYTQQDEYVVYEPVKRLKKDAKPKIVFKQRKEFARGMCIGIEYITQ